MLLITLIILSGLIPFIHINILIASRNESLALFYMDWTIADILEKMNINIYDIVNSYLISSLLISLLLMYIRIDIYFLYLSYLYIVLIIATYMVQDIYPNPLLTRILKYTNIDGHKLIPSEKIFKKKMYAYEYLFMLNISQLFYSLRINSLKILIDNNNHKDCIFKLNEYEDRIKNEMPEIKILGVNYNTIRGKLKYAITLIFTCITTWIVFHLANMNGLFQQSDVYNNVLYSVYSFLLAITRLEPELFNPQTNHEIFFILFLYFLLLSISFFYLSLHFGIIKKHHQSITNPFLEFKYFLLNELRLLKSHIQNNTIAENIEVWDSKFESYFDGQLILSEIREKYSLPKKNY